ncbi:hypothetical protein LMTR13_07900 [Bradyrhizobium icense]|uniref:CENP-V/GFA domain-containing protein n=2 Tax=Bradyrhizobium icense TaxID=1274631 RepID=A0A1B1UBI1_9BRAD|nr:hypothetical protein LMTR13_07900 [Bradyrhizobium icense]
MTSPKLPLTGGCSCTAIRYEIQAFPLLLYACNCTDCQTASGSAFALNMPVKRRHLSILRGKPKGWHRKSAAGEQVTTWFCGDCAAPLYGEREGRPDIAAIRAGTLDETSWLVPVAQLFMKSAQPWIKPVLEPECYESTPADFRTLIDKWRAMWPDFFRGSDA